MESLSSILGGRATKAFHKGRGSETTLDLRAAWAHEFNPVGDMTMRLAGDNANNPFAVTSPARLGDSAIVGASFAGTAFKRVKFLTSVDADLSSPIKLWTASVGLRAGW